MLFRFNTSYSPPLKVCRNERLHKLEAVNPTCLTGMAYQPFHYLFFSPLFLSKLPCEGDGTMKQGSVDWLDLIVAWFGKFNSEVLENAKVDPVANTKIIKTGISLISCLLL